MPLCEDSVSSLNRIESYDYDGIRINQKIYSSSIVVSAGSLYPGWPVSAFDALETSHLQWLLRDHPQVIILGCGNQQQFLNAEQLRPFAEAGVGVEVMTNDAACRTFNILLAEGRNVVAGFILST